METRRLRPVVVAALLLAGCGSSSAPGTGGTGGAGGNALGGAGAGANAGATGAGTGATGTVGAACTIGTDAAGGTTAAAGRGGTSGAAGTPGPSFSLLTYPVTEPGPGNSGIGPMALAPNGDLIVAGHFYNGGTFDLDPSAGIDNHTATGGSDAFVSRLGPDGVPRWTKVLTGTGENSINGLAVDDEGAIVMVGWFSGRADLDPGPAEYTCATSATTIPQAFVMKLSPAGDRRWLWSPGPGSASMAVASARGTVLVAGYFFMGAIDFDPGPAVDLRTPQTPLSSDIFVIALDGDGRLVRPAWTFGGPNMDTPYAVAIGPDGSWYVAGTYSNGTDFDPGSGVTTLPFDETQWTLAGFALALGPSGEVRWLKSLPPPQGAVGLTLDRNDRVTLWGQSRSAPAVYLPDQTFVTRVDRAGNVDWTRTWSPPIPISLGAAAADGSLALAGNTWDELVVEGRTFFNDGTNASTLLIGLSPLGETRSIQAFGDPPTRDGIGSFARYAMMQGLLFLPDGTLLLAGAVGGEVPLLPAGVATVPTGLAGFIARLPAP